MRRTSRLGALALVALVGAGCSTARPLVPLVAGQKAVEVSLPGMWMTRAQGAGIYPVASLVVGGRVGLQVGDQTLEARAAIHPGTLVRGVATLEGGVIWHPIAAHGWLPALHVEGDLLVATAPAHWGEGLGNAVRAMATTDVVAHWPVSRRVWPYLVVSQSLSFAEGGYVVSTLVGAQVQMSERLALSLESGLAGINLDNRRYSQPYLGVGHRGTIWMGFGVAYRFGEATP